MRDDEVQPSLPLADVLTNAPAVENNCFRVPVVLEGEG
jgi:Asp-tRNA(Asn)/Glu-tRNA(Gln) amidotransferase C subunit